MAAAPMHRRALWHRFASYRLDDPKICLNLSGPCRIPHDRQNVPMGDYAINGNPPAAALPRFEPGVIPHRCRCSCIASGIARGMQQQPLRTSSPSVARRKRPVCGAAPSHAVHYTLHLSNMTSLVQSKEGGKSCTHSGKRERAGSVVTEPARQVEQACKPSSVVGPCGPGTVIRLGRTSPCASSFQPGSEAGHFIAPLFGIAPGGV